MKILIFCTGNSCRSQMAHGFLQSFDDPSHVVGTQEFVDSEFRRVRDEIRDTFARFYITGIKNKVIK